MTIMRKLYILQIKRGYYWEDVLRFFDSKEAFSYQIRLGSQGIRCRIVEVVQIA